jgi:cellulose synthase/poly-beta-1,6-N-acetylglucosamine synthase-like glycosyltransferase
VIVNDGSNDRTLEILKQTFALRSVRAVYVPQLASAPVRGLYRSDEDSRLVVIDKQAGGSKADAINAGLNAATSPYACIVDADSVLEPDALLRIMLPILTDPKRVVAVGGIVRVLNGSEVRRGRVSQVRLPRKSIEIIQIIEYLRAFLLGRAAWARGNMLMIISGAFGVFRIDLVRSICGYRGSAIGEDIDLVLRLHRHLLDTQQNYKVEFVPDPVCWTEAPSDLRSLGRQRARWHKGLLDALWPNRDMVFRFRYGRVGLLALPYLWLFELVAPAIELLGLIAIVLAALLHALSQQFFVQFFLFGYAFATLISIGSILLEEVTYKRYNEWKDVTRLVSYCFLEHFPYRQMQLLWRLQGVWEYLRGDLRWKPVRRQGLEAAGQVDHSSASVI